MILFTINCDPRIQFATIMRRPIDCSTSGTKKSTVVILSVGVVVLVVLLGGGGVGVTLSAL